MRTTLAGTALSSTTFARSNSVIIVSAKIGSRVSIASARPIKRSWSVLEIVILGFGPLFFCIGQTRCAGTRRYGIIRCAYWGDGNCRSGMMDGYHHAPRGSEAHAEPRGLVSGDGTHPEMETILHNEHCHVPNVVQDALLVKNSLSPSYG